MIVLDSRVVVNTKYYLYHELSYTLIVMVHNCSDNMKLVHDVSFDISFTETSDTSDVASY